MDQDYRPRFHFAPEVGWLNDPNGLVCFEGEYHLFYQCTPESVVCAYAAQHWGHAVSTALVHWNHLPVALAPDPLGAIWSGSAVVDWRDTSGFFAGGAGLVAIFTHWTAADGEQRQSLAYSRDRGRSWTKYADNPVLSEPGLRDFRDPKVFWHAPTERWVMVVAIGNGVRFFTSPNLKDWRFASEFRSEAGVLARIWECPDLFPLRVDGDPGRERWVLTVSLNGRDEGTTMAYFVGEFDGTTFTPQPDGGLPVQPDAGPDFYAAVTWSDVPPADGRRLWLGWMSDWRYAHDLPTFPWRGAMSVPRELQLRAFADGERLVQHPVVELQRLRGPAERWADITIPEGVTPLPAASGTALEIAVEFAPCSARELGLHLRAGRGQRTVVGYDVAAARLFVDRTNSGETGFHDAFPGRYEHPLAPADGRVRLRIFVDRSSVEVFAADGRLVLTALIFPDETNDGVALYREGGEATVPDLTVYRLDPV